MAAVHEEEVLARSLVRVRSRSGEVVGAGFLVDTDVVCTCAHVVAQAAGLSTTPAEAPQDTVLLEFPLLRDDSGAVPGGRSTVVAWRQINDDDTGDVALMRLERPVPGTRPVPLVDGTQVWDHAFRVMGFPQGAEHGVWASGTLRGRQGAGWLQMETAAPGQRISPGFSGSPVWDDAQGGVVGMTVAVQRGTDSTTAYLTPSASLVDERILRPRCPFRGLAPFTEADAGLFHGREEETERLRAAVGRHPLTLVVGPSGCGKSSLIRAGLLPRLQAAGMTVSELRAVPGVSPAAVVARTVVPVLEPGLGEVDRLRTAAELAELLSARQQGAEPATGPLDELSAELRSRILAHAGEGGHVLFVDQLEEYAGADPSAARELLRLLTSLGSGQDPGAEPALRVVATARPESLDTLVTPGTADVLSGATQFLAPLSSQGLHRAVTAPVEAVPGLWFEAGLPERIVADAADEPGRMPLVEFVLTRLWERRDRAMLTHAAYDGLGGVAGALVGYAEESLRTHLAADEDFLARRLFAQMTRPDDSGGFSRRPARTADLDPALQSLARRLSPTKLVVLGRTPDGGEIVDLAHEALATLWPRLNQWLVDSRDFRLWQEQLRRDIRRWQDQGREPGALLRGSIRATASDWLERRPEDIADAESAYIRQSNHHHRRSARRWRMLAAVLTVLTLLAAGLAVSVLQSNRQVEAQLQTQASRLLADISDRHAVNEPALSIQLALAAWQTDPTPEAYAALLRQYARGQRLTGSHPGLWPGRFQGMRTTADGGTMVVHSVGDKGERKFTVITGLLENRPRQHQLREVPEGVQETSRSALSPDGRSYALAGADGRVWIWDLTADGEPRVLGSEDAKGRKVNGAALDYSSDGRRLLRMLKFFDGSGATGARDRHAAISAWDLPSGRRVATAPGLVPGEPVDVAFTADAGQVVFTVSSGAVGRRAVIRDLVTGRDIRAFTEASGVTVIAGGGELIVEEQGASGAERAARALPASPDRGRTVPLPPTAGVLDMTDATGEFAVLAESSTKGAYLELTLIELRTGKAYRTRTPPSGLSDAPQTGSDVAVVPAAGGNVTVIIPTVDALLTAVAVPVDGKLWPRVAEVSAEGALSPDGKYVARAGRTFLEVVTTTHGSREQVPWPLETQPKPLWTADSQWVVLERPDGGLSAFAARNPRRRVDFSWEDGDGTARRKGVEAFAPVQGSEVAVLTTDGRLMLVDASTGRRTGPPIQVERKTEQQTTNPLTAFGQLRTRPGHPYEMAVVTSAGTKTGTVEVWNVRTGTRLHTLTVGELEPVFVLTRPAGLLFTPDGKHLMSANDDGFLRRWDVDRGVVVGRPLAATGTDVFELVAFGVNDTLITYGGKEAELQFWDLRSGLLLAGHPASAVWGIVVRDERLMIAGEGWYQELDLRPKAMVKALCKGVGRDFTATERELLPSGALRTPPCKRSHRATEDLDF